MEVVYWQLFVVGSVLTAYVVWGDRASLWVAIAWTGWTLLSLAYFPLVLIQLFFAWGSYFAARFIRISIQSALEERTLRKLKEGELRDLKSHLETVLRNSNVSSSARDAVVSVASQEPNRISFIHGEAHYKTLVQAIVEAKQLLCVLSGWIGSPLLDQEIQTALRDALRRGVSVYIGYGWEGSAKGHELNGNARKARRFLDRLAGERTSGRILIAEFPNHEKALVCDDAFVVIGSNNWLSNRAFRNSERSVLVRSTSIATSEARRIIEMVKTNSGSKPAVRSSQL